MYYFCIFFTRQFVLICIAYILRLYISYITIFVSLTVLLEIAYTITWSFLQYPQGVVIYICIFVVMDYQCIIIHITNIYTTLMKETYVHLISLMNSRNASYYFLTRDNVSHKQELLLIGKLSTCLFLIIGYGVVYKKYKACISI